jgi:hypothetical protein
VYKDVKTAMRHKGRFVTNGNNNRFKALERGRGRCRIDQQDRKKCADATCVNADVEATIQRSTFSFPFIGRRVVELGFVAEQLSRGCRVCGTILQLVDTRFERRYGLGAIMRIECRSCGVLTDVLTGKRHYDSSKKKTMPVFDVNTKVAAGKIFQVA